MTSSKEVSNMKESELIKNAQKVIKMLFASFMSFIKTGFTSKECSKIVGLKPSSVRSKLSRSLAKMRNYLE